MVDRQTFRQCVLGITLLVWAIPVIPLRESCAFGGSRYFLVNETVVWSMTISSGQSCVGGVRLSDAAIESLKLCRRRQSGKINLQGPGFTYTAKANFVGEDLFVCW